MKNDPVDIRMRELSWRPHLTEAEQAELQAWLATHPEAQAAWDNEAELSALLSRLPNVPVSSNFTARVLQAVARETVPAASPTRDWAWWWRRFMPRAAVAAVILGGSFIAFHHEHVARQKQMTQSLAALSGVESLSNPAMLQDFEAIRKLTPATAPDKELLALFQ